MERVFSPEDRIKRAEEIYFKRQNLRDRSKKKVISIEEKPSNYKRLKKLILQITICVLIYCTFHLINTTNYDFSSQVLEKIKETLSKDYDFQSLYSQITNALNTYLYEEKEQGEEKQEENGQNSEENKENEQNEEISMINESVIDEEESLTQKEVTKTEESETDRIKRTYTFKKPLEGIISSEYGEREVNASVITAYHKGIDIAREEGTEIYASTSGEVIIAKESPTYGKYIMIENGEIRTVYAHCSELLVKVRRQNRRRKEHSKSRQNRQSNRTTPPLRNKNKQYLHRPKTNDRFLKNYCNKQKLIVK